MNSQQSQGGWALICSLSTAQHSRHRLNSVDSGQSIYFQSILNPKQCRSLLILHFFNIVQKLSQSLLCQSCPKIVSTLPPCCSKWYKSVVHVVPIWCPSVSMHFSNHAKWSRLQVVPSRDQVMSLYSMIFGNRNKVSSYISALKPLPRLPNSSKVMPSGLHLSFIYSIKHIYLHNILLPWDHEMSECLW